ncbi:MAG: UDP-N-acetylmuramoyl-tripeptide--D-alanyl-D-alanine ligase [Alphaproteobacteria bacterium]|jgi:UDP-N-acetylmuramoyl-tripeptide--D-alanyl-D-alanine ligase|nr:UDP-N-acetylmuramoyl-tripeptide--D-alanyl-D-alanine ligase [Alphaproteobacteria bacterium]
MQLNKADIIKALGDNLVRVSGDFSFKNYSMDTRTLMQGDCFIALKGNTDGHDYIAKAIALGAVALIIDVDFYAKNPLDFPNLIVVKDTLIALQKIASFNAQVFKENGGVLIGITGSVGKTTLKDMLSCVLAKKNIVSATLGNYNNHIGLPFSLAHLKDESRFGVFEMGMSAAGEISALSKILQPQVGIITEISAAHSEFFADGLSGIAKAKSEIFEGMNEQGVAFLNYDNTYFNFLKEAAAQRGITKIFSFSQENKGADIYVKSANINNYSMAVVANIFGEDVAFSIASISPHNAMLAALALGIAKQLGVDVSGIAFKIPMGRGNISKINNITLIDSSYNANPKSMASELLVLQNVDDSKIIVLGDMLEIGEAAAMEHINLKNVLQKLNNIKEIILVGDLMEHLHKEINSKHFSNITDAEKHLTNIMADGDVVFIKGSHGSGVHKISKYLQNLP